MTRAAAALILVVAALACGPPPEPLPRGFGVARDRGRYGLRVPRTPKLGPFALDDGRGVFTAPYGWGTATLTLDAPLQQRLVDDLRAGRPLWGAAVILDVKTGAILALAEHSEREPGVPGAAVRPLAKAASVFKIVTAAALVRAGVPLSTQVCGGGGRTRIKQKNLDDDGGRCVRFEDVLPFSQNVAMAKLAQKYLTPPLLEAEAQRFYFNRALPVDFEVQPSEAPIPTDDEFDFATTAAGFGDVKLGALHGALLATIAGNGGVMPPPHVIAAVTVEDPPVLPPPERVIDEDTAAALQTMMTATVAHGTAARAFTTTERGYRAFTDVPVAGKTGTLTDHKGRVGSGGLDYTWFVGTAPAQDPHIAVAVAMVNDEWIWYARALDIAKLTLKRYYALHPEDAASGPLARRAP